MLLLQGQEAGLAKETRVGYRRGEEGKASLLRGQWGPSPLSRSGFLPPSKFRAGLLQVELPWILSLWDFHPETPLFSQGSEANSCKHGQCCFPALCLVLRQLLLRRNEG